MKIICLLNIYYEFVVVVVDWTIIQLNYNDDDDDDYDLYDLLYD